MTLPIYLPGVGGRVGRILAECIAAAEDLELRGVFEAPGHPWIGKSLKDVFPSAQTDISVADAPPSKLAAPVYSIHFTWPAPTLQWLDWSVEHHCPMVIGTTGLEPEQVARVQRAGEKIPVVLAPNMSVGVNLLFALTRQCAKTLSADYDIEIVEMHHRLKKDAPSGTGARLGEIAAEARGLDPAKAVVHGRSGMIGERTPGQIGLMALRGGDVVGDHTVIFATNGERVELTHKASSRNSFAQGALKAVRFLSGKKNGFFDMQDVLGLR